MIFQIPLQEQWIQFVVIHGWFFLYYFPMIYSEGNFSEHF